MSQVNKQLVLKILKRFLIVFILFILFMGIIVTGIGLGAGIAQTQNIKNTEYFTEFETALPTKLLDINGELITEFSSDEKREIIDYQDLPQHLIDALITREDRIFFSHKGFSLKALFRAVLGQLAHISLGGGSTLTQQIAGTMYCDRTEMSMKRKLKELWWAIQMERRYSKNEILELYLNKIYFGGGTYGVNAASKYYFGHSAKEITPAECALLVVQLSNPAWYNPFDHPNRAMDRQKYILASMVEADYLTQEEADESFEEYWANFDYTRTNSSAYMMRDDKAPWFSEYVRRELGNLIYGSDDIYTSGFTVHTTLNLEHQEIADKTMQEWIGTGNRRYQSEHQRKSGVAGDTYIPLTELMSLLFDIPDLKVSETRSEIVANTTFMKEINPVLDVVSLITGAESLKMNIINRANTKSKQDSAKTTIEGTMIALDSSTGYIDAMVGGSKFDNENQFIRAVQAKLQPGSTFKPLYYSAAIDSRKFTPATEIADAPVIFYKADGGVYIPTNFMNTWEGNVQVWYALATSMNVPSLKVLDAIGFEAAIDRATDLLGIPEEEEKARGFIPGYPIGLGVCSVRPIELARAYSIFANGGKEVTPMAIRTVEDKNGNVILNPELDIRKKQSAKGDKIQVISPQTSFVMTKLLEKTVQIGTLHRQKNKFVYKTDSGKSYVFPMAGKTGTTQNWADAWTCGFSPYYTAAFWFGFDKPGQSLGQNITGATLAGMAWGDYMSAVHKDMLVKDFPKPLEGVIECTVCSVTGQILTDDCGSHQTTQWFLEGTQPTQVCSLHSNKTGAYLCEDRLRKEMYRSGLHWNNEIDTTPLTFNLDFLSDNYVFVDYDISDESMDMSETELKEETVKINPVEDLDYNFLME